MAIICKECKYALSVAGVIGDLTGKVCDITITYILPHIFKKSGSEDFCIFWANQQKIACPQCCKYQYWQFIEDKDQKLVVQVESQKENSMGDMA